MRITGSLSSARLVRRAGKARALFGRSLERVSSGKRINSGRDDAAGLAISSRMKAQAVSLKRTGMNMQDGAALARVADTGLSSIANQLIRMRELAVQAANDTNSAADRSHIQTEIDQILEEIQRIALQTEIFGLTPLHNPLAEEQINPPSKVDVVFLVDDSGSMGPEIANLKSSIKGFKTRLQAVSTNVRFGLMAIGKGEDAKDAADLVAQIGANDFDAQLAALGTGAGRRMDTYAAASEALGGSDTAGTQEPDLLLFDDDADKRLIILTDTEAQEGPALKPPGATQQSVADAASALGVVVDVIGDLADAADYLTLTDQTKGTHFKLGVGGAGVEPALSTIAIAIAGQTDKQIRDGPTVHAGVDADETIALGLPSDARPSTLGIAFGSGSGELTTKEKANDFLRDIDDALLTIARYQADAGAIINRLEIAQQAQSGAVESTLSTISRMESADMALESSALARSRVRMEAANAALARAFAYQRSIASSMLSLIGGNFNGTG